MLTHLPPEQGGWYKHEWKIADKHWEFRRKALPQQEASLWLNHTFPLRIQKYLKNSSSLTLRKIADVNQS